MRHQRSSAREWQAWKHFWPPCVLPRLIDYSLDVAVARFGGQNLGTVDFFTSHEGLVLEYEAANTRQVAQPVAPRTGSDASQPRSGTQTPALPSSAADGFYNTSAHMLWIGDRTRDLEGAHVEYFRGIMNPIGMKVGPSMKPDELVALIRTLNADNEMGRLCLITRFGADKVYDMLPPLIKAVQVSEANGALCCG